MSWRRAIGFLWTTTVRRLSIRWSGSDKSRPIAMSGARSGVRTCRWIRSRYTRVAASSMFRQLATSTVWCCERSESSPTRMSQFQLQQIVSAGRRLHLSTSGNDLLPGHVEGDMAARVRFEPTNGVAPIPRFPDEPDQLLEYLSAEVLVDSRCLLIPIRVGTSCYRYQCGIQRAIRNADGRMRSGR